MSQSIFPEVLLNSGRTIHAVSLHIDYTYAGLLAGYPYEVINRDIINHTAKHADRLVSGAPFLLIDPPREQVTNKIIPHRNYVKIPEFRIIAEFHSGRIGTEGIGSSLVIAWFETTTQPIMSELTRKQITEIDWENTAKDFEP